MIPSGFVSSPEEEFQYNNRPLIRRAKEGRLGYVSMIWHPWSLSFFDPVMRMLEMTFDHVHEQGLIPTTFGRLSEQLQLSST